MPIGDFRRNVEHAIDEFRADPKSVHWLVVGAVAGLSDFEFDEMERSVRPEVQKLRTSIGINRNEFLEIVARFPSGNSVPEDVLDSARQRLWNLLAAMERVQRQVLLLKRTTLYNDGDKLFKMLEHNGWEADESGETDDCRYFKIGNGADAEDMQNAIRGRWIRGVIVEILRPIPVTEWYPTDFSHGD